MEATRDAESQYSHHIAFEEEGPHIEHSLLGSVVVTVVGLVVGLYQQDALEEVAAGKQIAVEEAAVVAGKQAVENIGQAVVEVQVVVGKAV